MINIFKNIFKDKMLFLLFILLIFIALFLRLYTINTNFLFAFDQGDDGLIIKKIFETKRPPLVGPATGVAGFFVGPVYYYIIMLPYLISGGSPIAAISFLIFLSVIGIIISCLMVADGKDWQAFIICLFLLTFNYSHIFLSRWLSNPNPIYILLPLFYFALYYYFKSKKSIKIFKKIDLVYIVGFLLGLVIQTEFANAVFFIPGTLFLFLILKKFKLKELLKLGIGFVIAVSPLIAFNVRHDFIMVKVIQAHLLEAGGKANVFTVWQGRLKQYLRILSFFITGKNQWLFIISSMALTLYLFQQRFWRNTKLLVLTVLFLSPMFFLLFYPGFEGSIFDYYLISQPLFFLMLLSLMLSDWGSRLGKHKDLLLGLVLGAFAVFNIKEWITLQSPASNTISYGNKIKIIDKIYEIADSQPFTVEIFVPNLQPHGWYYLFEWYGQKKYSFAPKFEGSDEKLLFFVVESGRKNYNIDQYWKKWWYDQKQGLGNITGKERVGDISLEIRERYDQ